MQRYKNFWAALLISGLVGGGMLGTTAWAGPPTDAVRKSVDEVVRILEDPAWKKPEKKEERRKLLEQTIAQRFNFLEMSRRALGAEWNKRTPEEQKDFAASFQTLLANTYLGNRELHWGKGTIPQRDRRWRVRGSLYEDRQRQNLGGHHL